MEHTNTGEGGNRTIHRSHVSLTPEERAEIKVFQRADRRPSLDNAIVALALLGLEYWRTKARPKGQQLAPPLIQPAGNNDNEERGAG